MPEVEAAVRVLSHPGVSHHLIRYEDNVFYETGGFMADSTLFEIFTYDLIAGNAEKALTEPNTVVISDTEQKLSSSNMARAVGMTTFYFNDVMPIAYI